MQITNLAVIALRALLITAFALLVLLQTFSMPGQFAYLARENPDMAYLRWPLTALAAVGLMCVQVVIVGTWKLLTFVKYDRIFSDAALKWVDAIVWAIGTAWVLLLGVSLYAVLAADDPALPLILFVMLVGGAVLGLLVVVMRTLLQRATTLRIEMEAVI
jgi:hypothetical protein